MLTAITGFTCGVWSYNMEFFWGFDVDLDAVDSKR